MTLRRRYAYPRSWSCLLATALLLLAPAFAQAAPVIHFSDLTSGPKTGGENNNGAFVTLYGRGFGNSRDSSAVRIGSGAAAAYPIWSDRKITVQLGAAATTGNIVVDVAGASSNGVPFTVRSGTIRCVSPSGSDSASGVWGACWRTLPKAAESAAAGDVVYAMAGSDATGLHDVDASLNITRAATVTNPIALVTYPGATVTIGSTSRTYGIRAWNDGTSKDGWVIAGFTLRGGVTALGVWGAKHWRIAGNDISCPNGNGQTGCFESLQLEYLQFFGNNVHDAGRVGAQKQYHATYLGTDVNHVEYAYNRVHDNNACYGMQIHSSPVDATLSLTGFKQFDISVHHNFFWNQNCAAFNAYTVDPSKGPVRVYNNTVYNVAQTVSGDGGNRGCFYVNGDYVTNGPKGSGAIDYFNNILVNCGGDKSLNYDPGVITVNEHDNGCSGIAACTGAGSFSADPLFANVSAGDFRVMSTDPRFVGKGAEEPDLNSLPRPQNLNIRRL